MQQDGVPWCFRGVVTAPQYNVVSVQQQSSGFTAQIALANPGSGTYGPAITKLQLTAVYETAERVHFRLTDAANARYEIPQSILPYPQQGTRDFPSKGTDGSYDASNPAFIVSVSNPGQPLSLSVKRVVDGTVIFDLGALEYSDQYLQLTTLLPEAGAPILNGVGEHVRTRTREACNPQYLHSHALLQFADGSLCLLFFCSLSLSLSFLSLCCQVMNFQLPTDDHVFTMWDVDIPTPWDQNEYGSHPFLVQTLASNGLAHGLFVRSSNGMDVVTSLSQVQFRILGGILEWYSFVGNTHEQVFQQYHAVIGRPHLPPYWALGEKKTQTREDSNALLVFA